MPSNDNRRQPAARPDAQAKEPDTQEQTPAIIDLELVEQADGLDSLSEDTTHFEFLTEHRSKYESPSTRRAREVREERKQQHEHGLEKIKTVFSGCVLTGLILFSMTVAENTSSIAVEQRTTAFNILTAIGGGIIVYLFGGKPTGKSGQD